MLRQVSALALGRLGERGFEACGYLFIKEPQLCLDEKAGYNMYSTTGTSAVHTRTPFNKTVNQYALRFVLRANHAQQVAMRWYQLKVVRVSLRLRATTADVDLPNLRDHCRSGFDKFDKILARSVLENNAWNL